MKSPNKISLAKPAFDQQEIEAVRKVLESGWVVQGPQVAAFESRLAGLHRARHCIAVSSGTAALHISYLALGIGPGDAVFIPSFAWPSAANMALHVGARPVLVDVLPGTYNLDHKSLQIQLERCLAGGWGIPRAVVPVHEFGLAADMDQITRITKENDLVIIEDGACALGAAFKGKPVGGFGQMGILSFHPRKAITMGEGGAIITNNDNLAENCRLWRNHGQTTNKGKRDFTLPGLNYRMTEIQSAIGQVQLEKFPEILKKRKEIAEYYLENLAQDDLFTLPDNNPDHTWQTFMIVLKDTLDRSVIVQILAEAGIEAAEGSISTHCLKLYRKRYGYQPADLPVSRQLHEQGLALPLHCHLTETDTAHVCRVFSRAIRSVEIKTV